MAKLRVTLVRSGIGHPYDQKDTLRILRLTKMHKTVELDDTPSNRGRINKVSHLVRVEEVGDGGTQS